MGSGRLIPADIAMPTPLWRPESSDDLQQWSNDTVEWSNQLVNCAGVANRLVTDRTEDMIGEDLAANRPAAAGTRRFFYATDTGVLYYDVGTWVQVVGPAGALSAIPTPTGSGRTFYATDAGLTLFDSGTWQVVGIDQFRNCAVWQCDGVATTATNFGNGTALTATGVATVSVTGDGRYIAYQSGGVANNFAGWQMLTNYINLGLTNSVVGLFTWRQVETTDRTVVGLSSADNHVNDVFNNGAFLRYDSALDAGGTWRMVTANAGVLTVVNTGLSVVAGRMQLIVTANGAGFSTFVINGTLYGTQAGEPGSGNVGFVMTTTESAATKRNIRCGRVVLIES